MNSKARRSRAALALLVATLVIAPVVGGVGLVGAQDTADGNATDLPETRGYTVEDLETNGPRPSPDAEPSIRQYGDYGSFWLVHAPVRPFSDPSERSSREYIAPDTVVERQFVHIGAFRGWDADREDLTVHVVTWDVEEVERQVTENGTTYNESVERPANVTEDTVNVTLPAGGKPEVRVPLPEHHDEPKFVTVWVEGHEETLRWVFRYSASKATESVPLATRGGLAAWGFMWIGLPFVGAAAAMVGVNKVALKKAVRTPDAALAELVFLALVVAFFAGFVFFNGTLETLAIAPWSVGLIGGLFVGVLYLFAFGENENEALAIQFSATEATARPDGSGIWRAPNQKFSLHERDDGTLVATRDGWLAFLARSWPFRDVTAEVEFDGDPETRLKGDEDSEFSDVFVIDPEADDVIVHETEGWTFSFPSMVSWPTDENGERAPLPSVAWGPLIAVTCACAVVYYAITGLWQNTALAALGVCAVLLVAVTTPLPATVRLDLAPFQYGSVLENVIKHREEYDEVADSEHFQEKYYSEKARSDAKRKRDREREDKTVLEELSEELAGTSPRDDDRGDDGVLDEPQEVEADD